MLSKDIKIVLNVLFLLVLINLLIPSLAGAQTKTEKDYLTTKTIQDSMKRDSRDSSVALPDSEYLPAEGEYVPVDSQPLLIKGVYPEYPESAREKNISGSVFLAILVDREGKVRKAKIAKSSGDKNLDKTALKVAYENIYRPAIAKDGKAVAIWIYYPVKFMLSNIPPAPK